MAKKIDKDLLQSFFMQLTIDHTKLINDIVKAAIDSSDTWGEAHRFVDKVEESTNDIVDNTGDGSTFVGICRRSQAELTRRERKQKINHDSK